jgi:DNA polymerase I-like protein with 3'-5' exonuclease and polymerase domains
MGSASLTAVGIGGSITKLRGTPVQIPNGPPALPILHAAFVMREEGRVQRPLFHADVAKAVRLSRGGNTWQDPLYFVPKTATEIYNFLAVPRPRVAVDVETDGKDAWSCRLRRIGIGTDREVMIYAPLSVRGHLLMPEHEIETCQRVIAGYFQTDQHVVLHNGIGFDSIVLHRHGVPLRDDTSFDTMIAHQIGPTSELPHRLDFLGSMYTDARFWKDDAKHSEIKDDATLDKYLSYDIAVTYLSEPYVIQNVSWAKQEHIYNLDAELFRIARSMAALGIWIDPAMRWKFAAEYQEKSDRLKREFVEIAGRDINPGSPVQVRKLLYHDLGLPMLDEHMTDSGDPSTDEPTLLDLLAVGLDDRARKVIHGLLGYREAEKLLGVNTGHIVDGHIEGGPIVHADGRVRSSWRPGKRSGRWGSSDPNCQNIPKKLRAMFKPAPGNKFVAADMSAVELRQIALLAGDEPLIEAFKAFDEKRGPDVHIFNACSLFRCKPEDVNDEVRNFVKRFVYALSYDAGTPTIYRTLSLLRNDNLEPLFPHITLAEVERVYNLWWKVHPAIVEWKRKLILGWRSHGFIATAYHQRKRFFIGGEKREEMGNHPIQGASADMQNDAVMALVASYPFDFVQHRGLVIQGHDQLVVECGAHETEHVKKIVERVMQKRIGPMYFPAVAKAADDWKAAS